MTKKVILLNPKPQLGTSAEKTLFRKLRVAVYARVSTASDEQLNSVEAQKDYYPKLISKHSDWEFSALYADEGISGTSNKNRPQFNQMVDDALAHKFELIITKSISRFARNTVDTLTTIRKLKAAGVEIYFEKEDIFTFDGKGEFMLTLLSSLAQEESRSLSENVKWGIRKRFADGQVWVPYKRFLGYRKGANGRPAIVDAEATTIRKIYRLYLEGRTTSDIATILTSDRIHTPAGCQLWRNRTIISILTNEKYYGVAMLQKTYSEDFMTKKQKINEGEFPRYFVEDSHDPIISESQFNEVQRIMALPGTVNPSHNTFANKIICGDCGGIYGRKIDGSYRNSKKYRKAVWKCNRRYSQPKKCTTPVLHESDVILAFNKAILSLWQSSRGIRTHCLDILDRATLDGKEMNGERRAKFHAFVANFGKRLHGDIEFDEAAWRVTVVQVLITNERLLHLRFINGRELAFEIPRHVPHSSPL